MNVFVHSEKFERLNQIYKYLHMNQVMLLAILVSSWRWQTDEHARTSNKQIRIDCYAEKTMSVFIG